MEKDKKDKKPKLTQEQKDYQIGVYRNALMELEIKKKSTILELKRNRGFIEAGVPEKEIDDLIHKFEVGLETGFLNENKITELNRIKITIEVELLKEEKEMGLPKMKANNVLLSLEKQLKQIEREINSCLELIKQFR